MNTSGRGFYEVTGAVRDLVKTSGVSVGVCILSVPHTSATVLVQERADPTSRHDMESYFQYLVPRGHSLFTHTHEGEDDPPSHIIAALIGSSCTVPVVDGDLVLGEWQGVFFWELRDAPRERRIDVVVVRGQ